VSLPIFKNDDSVFQLMQTSWAASINPVIELPINNGHLLQKVSLISGTSQVNHLLARKLQGWFIVRQRSAASIYDNQDNNQTPQLTLSLISSAAVVVDLFVF